MAALRLARGYTGRKIILKMDGHFHGMHEMIWYNHGNFPDMNEDGEVVRTVPDSGGIPDEMGAFVKVIRYNDIHALEAAVDKYNGQIAAVIMEPISFNCGCFAGIREYLQQVREICTKNGIILIFDEVICGMRFRPRFRPGLLRGVSGSVHIRKKPLAEGFRLPWWAESRRSWTPSTPTVRSCAAAPPAGRRWAFEWGLECLNMVSEPWFFDQIEKNRRYFIWWNKRSVRETRNPRPCARTGCPLRHLLRVRRSEHGFRPAANHEDI